MTPTEEYLNAPDTELPFKGTCGITVNELTLSCPECNADISNTLKPNIQDWAQCIVINTIGVCMDCKLVVKGKPVRWYSDGRVMLYKDGSWYYVTFKVSWFKKIINWIVGKK